MNSTTTIKLHRMKRYGKDGKAIRFVWIKRWWDSNGKLCGQTIGDCREMSKRDAQAIIRKSQSDMDGGKIRRDRPMPLTLAQFRDKYMELVRGSISQGSMMLVRQAFKWATNVLGENIDVSQIDAVKAARIRNAMADSGSEPPTIQKVSAYLRAAFNRGIKFNLLHSNPFAGAEMPKGASRAKAAVIRTPDEIAKLKAAAPDAWWRSLVGLLFTGLREEEATSLQWDSVDFDGSTVTIRQRDAGTVKALGENYPIIEWQAKTANSYRVVPVASDTMHALRQLREGSDGGPYVFLSLHRLAAIQWAMETGKWGERKLLHNLLAKFQALQRRTLGAEVEVCTLHDCRKAFCTHASAVVPIQSLAAMIGDDPKTLMKYYLRPRDVDADAIRKLTDSGPTLKLAG